MKHALGPLALAALPFLTPSATAQPRLDPQALGPVNDWHAALAHFGDVRAELAALDDAELAALRADARLAASECPYRSATLALIETLQADVARLWSTRPDAPNGDDALAVTVQGQAGVLAEVRALLGAWNVLLADLEVAELGPPTAAVSTDEMLARLRTVMADVEELSRDQRDRIDAAAGRVDHATSGAWLDKGVLVQVRQQLRTLERQGSALIELSAEDALRGNADAGALLRRGILVRRTAGDLLDALDAHISLFC